MRIIITESQEKLLIEVGTQQTMVTKIVAYLDGLYKPIKLTTSVADEFYNLKKFEKLDGESITPKQLLAYIKKVFTQVSDKFIKQVIIDWSEGTLKNDNGLSKNIPMN